MGKAYHMGMPEMAQKWTREMVLALPDDGNRYELFDGELLVTPGPGGRHQFVVSLLCEALFPYVRKHRLGHVLTSPADLSLGGDQLSQPDLFVVPLFPRSGKWSDFPDPVLIVEVLSPGTAQVDRVVKRRRFQRAGIPEYWIVDCDSRLVERWRPADERPEIIAERLRWEPENASEPLDLDLPNLFLELWGDG